MQLIASSIAQDHPATNKDHSAVLTPLSVTPPGERGWASMILGALVLIVFLTLVVACANVTNLLLGLSTSRRHEMLVRATLGASRLQLVMPLCARAPSWASSRARRVHRGVDGPLEARHVQTIARRVPADGFLDLRSDTYVLLVTLVISVVAGVAVGLAPALRGASDGLSGAINRELGTAEPRKARIRRVLVVVQMAIATVVLVGVGLSIHSLVNLQHVSLGFSARNLVFGGVDVQRSGYDSRTGPAFYVRMRERLLATPGVEAVTIADNAP